MSSRTEICNLALGHIGTGKFISDLDTDQSTEGVACRRYYEQALKQYLRDFPWPFAKRQRDLALIEENPNDEWTYSYRYPSDCLLIHRIYSGVRNDSRQSRIPYLVASDDTGKLIYSSEENACIWYTKFNNDPITYPNDFILAFSYLVAWYISPLLTKGDPFKIRNEILQAFRQASSNTMANAFNEEQAEEDVRSEFERDREGYFEEEYYKWRW